MENSNSKVEVISNDNLSVSECIQEWLSGEDAKKFLRRHIKKPWGYRVACFMKPNQSVKVLALRDQSADIIKSFVVLEESKPEEKKILLGELRLFNLCNIPEDTRRILYIGKASLSDMNAALYLLRSLIQQYPIFYKCKISDPVGTAIINQLVDSVGGYARMDTMSYFDTSNVIYCVNDHNKI